MITRFQPHPGSWNEQYVVLSRQLAANPITQTSTQRHFVALPLALNSGFPNVWALKDGVLTFTGATAPDFTGTLTARLVKRTSGGTVTALTAATSISDEQAQFSNIRFTPLSTATEANLTVQEGDLLGVELTHAGGTIAAQPSEVQLAIRVRVIKS